MSEFTQLHLEDMADIRVSNVDKKTFSHEESVRLCNYMDTYSNNVIRDSFSMMHASASKSEISRFELIAGDVVITKDSESPNDIAVPVYIGEYQTDFPMLCGYHQALLRPKSGKIHGEFLCHLLRHTEVNNHFAKLATGSTRFGLSLESIHKLPLFLPALEEQKRIAEILSAVDEQIETYQTLLDKQTLIAKGLQAEISEMDCEWVKLQEHFDIQSGTTPSRAREDYYGEGTPWVKTLDLDERALFKTDEYLTEIALAECKPRVVPAESVLVAMYGGWEQIGRTALLGRDCCTNQAISSILPGDAEDWDMRFVFHSLKALRYKWRRYGVSTRKDPNITKADVCSFLIPMPKLSEQTNIAERLESAFALIDEYKTVMKKSKALKNALMHDLLTGKTRVPC
ncbi:MAG: restriction endonuclease subunit S [Limnobacter sp.]|uniref:restriction endonuclease subunit S n=1 Tax=Limnobacter sp. TaxID=2003368 RepID=UPI00121DEE3D|nr:restriction endonuclease subunit S [Limnobacter sp.]RZO91455.1 MAG: restriction endonuclease subunit S [Limnobacter sp.]